MPLTRSGAAGRVWREFQSVFSEFSGLSVQTFDAKGAPVQPLPVLPPLCAFLHRQPETLAACQKDCFRKAGTCRESRRVLAARCYAGLSYRIVPLRRLGKPHAVIIVGRALTEVLGEEQRRGFIARYRLSNQAFLESQAGVRSLGATELDRVASFVRTLATGFVAADSRLQHRHGLLARRGELLDLARRAAAFHQRGPGEVRELLQSLATTFGAAGAALLLPLEGADGHEVLASVGLGEDGLHALAEQDWRSRFAQAGDTTFLAYERREEMIRAGFDVPQGALAVQRLTHGPWDVGYLALAGATLSRRERDLLASASEFLVARVVHRHCRELAVQREQESDLLGRLAEKCLTARSVDEILPLALDAAMRGLRARRGSILLAEERGRITARALRGDHAPISASIEVLPPGSISHRVFHDRKPILIHDIDREPHLKREREYPYSSRSFVSVPLRDDGHALGVLHLTEREGEEAFTPRDLAWLERLSVQASGAIRKARLEQEVEQLRVACVTDHLTGVHNRRYLEEQLALELQRAQRFGQPLTVGMLDLDDFKALNDELGHESGDRVLREVAAAVRAQLRAVDAIARYGGDEFAVVLPGTGERGAAAIAERIRARVQAVPLPDGASSRVSCTVSIGLAVTHGAAESAADLLQRADQALLQAKRGGRNTALLAHGVPA
ncbi:MAG TPA: diguanylate cyclase [bacterium]